MANYYDWESLTDAVQDRCREILEIDVAPVARDILRKRIQKDIYAEYDPRYYQRRGKLADKVHSTYWKDENTLFITSGEHANKSVVKGYEFVQRYPGAFMELIEHGPYGIWTTGFPRPAIANAQDEINNSSKIHSIIQKRLDEL